MKTIELKGGKGYKINPIQMDVNDVANCIGLINKKELQEYFKMNDLEFRLVDMKKIDLIDYK